jgi:hypothetical protein
MKGFCAYFFSQSHDLGKLSPVASRQGCVDLNRDPCPAEVLDTDKRGSKSSWNLPKRIMPLGSGPIEAYAHPGNTAGRYLASLVLCHEHSVRGQHRSQSLSLRVLSQFEEVFSQEWLAAGHDENRLGNLGDTVDQRF